MEQNLGEMCILAEMKAVFVFQGNQNFISFIWIKKL